MESDRIYWLIDKYWDCGTSEAEEKELQDFFNGGQVPADLEQYIPVFAYREQEQSVTLSADFDRKLQQALKNANKREYITFRIFAPALRIAASFLLLGGLGISLFFISQQNNKPQFAETYNDPDAAFKHATFALEKLSDALQTGEDASRKLLQNLDEMDIDWAAIDSINISAVEPLSIPTESVSTEVEKDKL